MTRRQRGAYCLLFAAYLLACAWVILMHRTLETLNWLCDPRMRSLSLTIYWNGAESLANILIFVPMGAYIALLSRRPLAVTLLFVLAATAGFETLQYVLACGTCDVMDVINNFAGGALGVFLCGWLLRRLGAGRLLPLAAAGTAAFCLAVCFF